MPPLFIYILDSNISNDRITTTAKEIQNVLFFAKILCRKCQYIQQIVNLMDMIESMQNKIQFLSHLENVKDVTTENFTFWSNSNKLMLKIFSH